MPAKTSKPAKQAKPWHKFTPCAKEGKQAAIYTRVSVDEHGDKETTALQRQKGIDLCKTKGWKYKVYSDVDLSGFDGPERRPQLKQMLDDITNGLIHAVVLQEPKRLARDLAIMDYLIKSFILPNGVELVGTMTKIDITNPDGKAMLSFEMIISEKSVTETTIKAQEAKHLKARKGTLMIKHPYGYKSGGRNKVVVDEHQASILKSIFAQYAGGKSLNDIATSLNDQDEKTKQGGEWTHRDIRKLLCNKIFIGLMTYLGEEIATSLYTPLIDKALFEKVQTRLQERGFKRGKVTSHLLTGLVRCAYCLERQNRNERAYPTMVLNKQNQKLANGKRQGYNYFYCQTQNKGICRCENIRFPEVKLDCLVELLVVYLITKRYGDIMETADTSTMQAQIAKLEKESERLTKRKGQLISDYGLGDISKADFAQANQVVVERKEKVDVELRTLLAEYNKLSVAKSQSTISEMEKWKALPPDRRKELLRTILSGIIIHGDHITIVFVGTDKKIHVQNGSRIDTKNKRQLEVIGEDINLIHIETGYDIQIAIESGSEINIDIPF